MNNRVLNLRRVLFSFFVLYGACHVSAADARKPSEPLAKADQFARDSADVKALIAEVVAANGGIEAYRALKSISYKYTYRSADKKEDVSQETYLIAGEKSLGTYTKRDRVSPNIKGKLVQIYDGVSTRVKVDGKEISDPVAIKMADFLRKTNFYWFAMMFKLSDPGLHYELLKPSEGKPTRHHRVKVTFSDQVGDAQDTYTLYINKKTKLVDQFLFTVMDFGKSEPQMMEVSYKKVGNLMLPVQRRYTASDWDGNISKKNATRWNVEIMENVLLNVPTPDALK